MYSLELIFFSRFIFLNRYLIDSYNHLVPSIILSSEEHADIQWKLEHIPSSITGRQRQNIRTTLKKKLHEHELASTYTPFTPSNYQQFFINRKTSDLTLLHLIEVCAISKIFIIDTESIIVRHRSNQPALIQIQILLPTSISYVLIIEVFHLPLATEPTFQLITQFFHTLFRSDKTIYIWGEISELNDFTSIGLFTSNQIYLSNNVNFQNLFKIYWNDNYQHTPPSIDRINDKPCQCEMCLGINSTNKWSLQNAVAYTLNQYLDKRITKSDFNIGLDPQLYHFNLRELEHRQQLIHYAINDCLSIYQLLLKLKIY